jgi:hypothetical protein
MKKRGALLSYSQSRRGDFVAVLPFDDMSLQKDLEYLCLKETKNAGRMDDNYNYYSLVNMPVFDEIKNDPRMHKIIKREKDKLDRLLLKYKLAVPGR